MAIYNALFEAASKMKKGAQQAAGVAEGAAKSTRERRGRCRSRRSRARRSRRRSCARRLHGSRLTRSAWAGIGLDLGGWSGAAGAIDATGEAVKKS